jgi:uncharacterized protein (TIGR02594 family)
MITREELIEQICVTALDEMDVSEISGGAHNPRIIEYHSATSLKSTSDEVPWCASFVNWVLRECGIHGTDSAMARSFINWGIDSTGKRGDIVVLSRGRSTMFGHVGFLWNKSAKHIQILGGNQSDKVKLSSFPVGRIVAIRTMSDRHISKHHKNQTP